MTHIKIIGKLDSDNYEEASPAWHGVLDLSYFDSKKLISVSEVANCHSISEADVLHNISLLLEQGLVELVEA